jgi:hypothetical protein
MQTMDHNSQQHWHMPLRGPALLYPLMPLVDQYFRTHFNVLQAKHKQLNFINNKESIHNPNIFTKATNIQIRSQTKK